MNNYRTTIRWSADDKAFIAKVTELPGCAADGATKQAALKNVDIVVKEWIATAKSLGRPIPEPKGRLVFASAAFRIERIAMLRYGINDIRLFYENDVRFLKQF